MTETTEEKEKAQQMAERYHSTDFKDLKIKTLEAQVNSLKSLLSKAEEENKELLVLNAKLQEFFDRCLAYEDYIDICSIHSLAEGLFNHFSKKEEALASLKSKGEEQ